MLENISEFIPHCDRMLMTIGAALGAAFSFLVGEITDAFLWLLVFLFADYVTGTFAAWKNHELSSSVGFRGIVRTLIIVGIVCLAHGLDVASSIKLITLRDVTMFAFCLNESISILENVGRLGYASVIPEVLRRAIKALHDRQQNEIAKIEGLNNGQKD